MGKSEDKVHYEIDPCRRRLAQAVVAAAGELAEGSLDLDWQQVFGFLEKPPEPKLGDYALPCFRFAKSLKKKPQEIAALFAQALQDSSDGWVQRCQTAGPFLNIFVDKTKLAEAVIGPALSGAFFQVKAPSPEKVMIEFSQPNTHKILHVGHVRNMVLGDSLCRLYRYCGYEVVAANYPGDEGAHIAKCLWYIRKFEQSPPEEDRGVWLGKMYEQAGAKLNEADESLRKTYDREVSEVLAAIESKQGAIYEKWQETRQWSLELFYEAYEWMNVSFDTYFFESEVSEESQEIVDEYLKKGVFVESEGAVGCQLEDFKLGFMIVRKRDGNTLYATKDLVLARRKFNEFQVDRSIYVVGSEQNFHFRQVFKTLELMGFEQASRCFHLSYGMVRLPEGKMSSRSGTVVAYQELRENLREEIAKVMAKYQGDWSEEEICDASRKLAVGALRYGMTNTDPVKDVVYQASDWVSFEGNTGPYLMYSFARTQSILRRAAEAGMAPNDRSLELLTHETEHDLLRQMYDFNECVWQATHQYKPSLLCHRLYELCRAYNRVYAQVSVLKAENDNLKQARVNLLAAFSAVLAKGLDLLGITPPSRM